MSLVDLRTDNGYDSSPWAFVEAARVPSSLTALCFGFQTFPVNLVGSLRETLQFEVQLQARWPHGLVLLQGWHAMVAASVGPQ